jgi:nudix-type nucleoside diphosphatase (YffH/AdpP family)
MRKVSIRSRVRLLDDFFKVDAAEISFERFDGTMTPPVRRLVFERGDSVAAVVFNRDTRRLLFTEQFRFPTVEKGPGWLTEVPAGMVAEGEAPEQALRREIEEEIGYATAGLQHISTFYVSPGGSSERIWLYYAEVSSAGRIGTGAGLAGEHEEIRIVEVSLEEARERLATGEMPDAKTIIGLQWLLARQSLISREGSPAPSAPARRSPS